MNAKRAPNINAVLAENIRTLMNKKQLVQTTLAKAAGMTGLFSAQRLNA